MTLTKPRFQRHFRLEPLPQSEIKSGSKKYCVYKADKAIHHTMRETLPPISFPKAHLDKKDRDVYKDWKRRSCESVYKIPETQTRATSKNSNVEKHCPLNSNKASDHLDSPLPDHKPILTKVYRGVSWNNKTITDSGVSKHVSFTIPPLLTDERHHNNETKTDYSKLIDKKVVSSTIPMRAYNVTKQECTTTKSIERSSTLRHYEVTQQMKTFLGGKQQLDHEYAHKTTKNLSNDNKYNLMDKIQSRRARGYLVTHRLPKLPRKTEILPNLSESNVSHVSVLHKARQMLLEKMKNSNYVSPEISPKRKVLFLPSLAAPCSDEFAITMRRTHGHRYISSPAILDHVVTRNVPMQTTVSFLDAILRPPSGLIVS